MYTNELYTLAKVLFIVFLGKIIVHVFECFPAALMLVADVIRFLDPVLQLCGSSVNCTVLMEFSFTGTGIASLSWWIKANTTGTWRNTETCAGQLHINMLAQTHTKYLYISDSNSFLNISQVDVDDSMWSGGCH